MGGKLKSEKSSQAGVGFVEFLQGCGGALKSQKKPKKTPMALFRVLCLYYSLIPVSLSFFLTRTLSLLFILD